MLSAPAIARAYTNFKSVFKVERSGCNKSRELAQWMAAVISGLKSSPMQRAEITECKKTAGWVTLVWRKSSSVPLNIISVIRYPRISFLLSNNSFRSAELFSIYKLSTLPGNTNYFLYFSVFIKAAPKVRILFIRWISKKKNLLLNVSNETMWHIDGCVNTITSLPCCK